MKHAVTIFRSGLAILIASAGVSAHAADSASLAYASGNSTQMARVGVQWRWDRQWRVAEGVNIGGYWDLTLAQWHGTRYRNTDRTQNITDIGFTPVFRLQNDSRIGWYGEAGIGVHLLSSVYDNAGRQLSTAFQFGDHVGVGYVTRTGWDVGLLFQHFSNGGIKQPNGGVNFGMVRVSYSF